MLNGKYVKLGFNSDLEKKIFTEENLNAVEEKVKAEKFKDDEQKSDLRKFVDGENVINNKFDLNESDITTALQLLGIYNDNLESKNGFVVALQDGKSGHFVVYKNGKIIFNSTEDERQVERCCGIHAIEGLLIGEELANNKKEDFEYYKNLFKASSEKTLIEQRKILLKIGILNVLEKLGKVNEEDLKQLCAEYLNEFEKGCESLQIVKEELAKEHQIVVDKVENEEENSIVVDDYKKSEKAFVEEDSKDEETQSIRSEFSVEKERIVVNDNRPIAEKEKTPISKDLKTFDKNGKVLNISEKSIELYLKMFKKVLEENKDRLEELNDSDIKSLVYQKLNKCFKVKNKDGKVVDEKEYSEQDKANLEAVRLDYIKTAEENEIVKTCFTKLNEVVSSRLSVSEDKSQNTIQSVVNADLSNLSNGLQKAIKDVDGCLLQQAKELNSNLINSTKEFTKVVSQENL